MTGGGLYRVDLATGAVRRGLIEHGELPSDPLVAQIPVSVRTGEQAGTYGYRITQDVQKVLDISESTLYPVLRRLMKDGCLTTYDQAYAGRNRRYYQITEHGRAALRQHRIDWQNYRSGIDTIFFGGVNE